MLAPQAMHVDQVGAGHERVESLAGGAAHDPFQGAGGEPAGIGAGLLPGVAEGGILAAVPAGGVHGMRQSRERRGDPPV